MTRTGQLRLPALDARLRCVEELVPICNTAADIGCDHGKLGLHLLHSGKCRHVVFGDISDASLNKARNFLAFHRLDGQAAFVVSDGLQDIEQALDAVVISGLGGETISGIIQRDADKLSHAQIIVSPQTEAGMVRRQLWQSGFELKREVIVRSRGRYYTVIQAARASRPVGYSDRELFVGAQPEGYADTSIADYMRWRLEVMRMDRRANPAHIAWLREEIDQRASDSTNNL